MATNLSVESPDFDYIRHETGLVTSNAIKLLWEVINAELATRRKGVARASNYLQGTITSDVSTAQEDNLDAKNSLIWWYNTASSFSVTGIRNGVEGRIIFFHNVGTGTITFVNNSGSSDTTNRILTQSAGNVARATGKSFILMYINARWRELSL